jgi:hypothetical protein
LKLPPATSKVAEQAELKRPESELDAVEPKKLLNYVMKDKKEFTS